MSISISIYCKVSSGFKSLSNTNKKLTFIIFDIVDYYPSITRKLFDKAIEWARNYTEISKSDVELFYQTKKSFLFCSGETWTKRENSEFDNQRPVLK